MAAGGKHRENGMVKARLVPHRGSGSLHLPAAGPGAWLLALSPSRKALNSSPASCFRLGAQHTREAPKLFLEGFPLQPLSCARPGGRARSRAR